MDLFKPHQILAKSEKTMTNALYLYILHDEDVIANAVKVVFLAVNSKLV